MQNANRMLTKIYRAILALVLLLSVTGVWACLWVPAPF